MDQNGHYGQKLSKPVQNCQNSQNWEKALKTVNAVKKVNMVFKKTVKNGQKLSIQSIRSKTVNMVKSGQLTKKKVLV